MSDETSLLPCPFCGGEAHIANDYSSERDETRWNLWHECNGHEGESNGYGYSLHPWFETPWYKTEAEAIAAWNTRAAKTIGKVQVEIEPVLHGTLTAEQVREAVMSADRWEKPMGDTGLTNTHLIIRDDGWQAIAEELNVMLGSGTCEFVVKDNMNESEGMGDVWIECSACHCQFDYYADDWLMKMSYCPNCSARNRKAVGR